MANTTTPTFCSMHRQVPAAWRCGSCGRDLCEQCAAPGSGAAGGGVACTHCGRPADALRAGARILEERLADPDGARRLYEHLLEHFPAHELAATARSRLETLGRG